MRMITPSRAAVPEVSRASALVLLAASLSGCGDFGGGRPTAVDASAQWQMVTRYCTDCHNTAENAGGVAFDRLGPHSVAERPDIFESTVRKLRGRLMPPPDARQPDAEAIFSFISWAEGVLDETSAANPQGLERIALHRLNRNEYANAVRDLLALEIDTTELLPQDEVMNGFDNMATALQVSPSFLEQYVAAAREVAVRAVGRPDAAPGSQTYSAAPGTQYAHVRGLPLGTRGGILAEHYFPADGEYVVDVADVAGGAWGVNLEFENTLIVTFNGERVYETVVGGDEDMKAFDQVMDGVFENINSRLKNIRFHAPAGPGRVGVAFLRRSFAESDARFQSFVPGGGQDRVFRISSFQISGPFNPTGLGSTPSRDRIFSCHPLRGDEARACAQEIITSIGTRAFRRPLSEADIADMLEYYEDGLAAGGFEEGVRSALTGILASPDFLYRTEALPRNLSAGELYRIDDLELASKLSFFLWSSIPDDELLDAALEGRLSDPEVLGQQVRRMLADPRAAALASDFAYQWLHLDHLDEVVPERSVFPYAAGVGDLRSDFIAEVTLFVKSIFDEDRSVTDLLTADHTYLNERLALHYDIHHVKGDRFRRVQLEHSARWGLLGKGAVLMATAYPNRTSPVLRGAYILEHITGTPPAPPPPDVEALADDDVTRSDFVSLRELMAAHSNDPMCFGCHGVMDALGFAMENFDGVGAWRERERMSGALLDTSGRLPDGTELNGPDDVREALMRRPEQFVQTFTERLLTYAMGRPVAYYDMPAVRRIVRETAADDWRFSALVTHIVQSEPFLNRRVPEPVTMDVTAQNHIGRNQ